MELSANQIHMHWSTTNWSLWNKLNYETNIIELGPVVLT